MIPEDIRPGLRPALAAPGEDVARALLPCGVALKFVYEAQSQAVTWAQLNQWGVSLQAVGEVAARNTPCRVGWEEAEAGVFLLGGTCWQAVVLDPAGFIDPKDVPGRPVLYISDGSTAVLTGADGAAGLAYIRRAMQRGLGTCAMALNGDCKTWSRFYVHDATAVDLHRVTVRGHGKGEGRYVRQSSPPSHYGHVILEVAPYSGRHEYLLVWAVDEKTIPSEYREAVWEGIQGFATDYFREGGPLVGVRVTITGGSSHDVDSKAASYRIAAGIAFKNAVMQMEVIPLPERRRERSSREEEDTGAVLPEGSRLAELKRLGVSDPLLRMSGGALLHEAFRFWYTVPPLYSYSGAAPPEGPPFVPLWDHADNVVGVRDSKTAWSSWSITSSSRVAIGRWPVPNRASWPGCS